MRLLTVFTAAAALLAAPFAIAGETPAPAELRCISSHLLTDADHWAGYRPIRSQGHGRGTGWCRESQYRTPSPADQLDPPKGEDLDYSLPADDNVRHFGGGQTEATLDLPKGTHTLQLLLGDANHIPHNPPVLSGKITITVK